jgi:hypothetical protein
LKLTDADPPYTTAEIGTPRDYTSDVYRVYFEVPDPSGIAGKIIADFVGSERAASIIALAHGYETELPIQCVPEIVRLLSAENMAIYQVVRFAKTNKSWS